MPRKGPVSVITFTALGNCSGNATLPTANIKHMQYLVVTQDAPIIIRRGDSHVTEYERRAVHKVWHWRASRAIQGSSERMLNARGPLGVIASKVRRDFT